jgi:hypothetical protein
MTPGSWWKNKTTGQRLVVPREMGPFKTEQPRWRNRFATRHGVGRTPDLFPCYVEGDALFLRWLTVQELRASHRPYRPPSYDRVALPRWLTKPEDFNDFILDDTFWGGIAGIRGNLIAFVGLYPSDQHFTNWGTARYSLAFVPTKDARTRFVPKYNQIHPTAWDKINGADH